MTEPGVKPGLPDVGRKLDALEHDIAQLYEFAPFACHSVRPDGTYDTVNTTELAWLGLEAKDLIGKLRPESFLVTASQAILQQHMALFGPVDLSGLELELLGRAGKTRAVALYRVQSRTPGVVGAHLRTMLFDISAKRDLREHQRIAALAFDSVVGTCVTGRDARVLRVNGALCELTGYTTQELLGRNLRMLSSGRHDPAFYAAMWGALRDGGAWQGEIVDRRKDGSLFTAWLSISAIRDAGGEVSNYVGSLHDVSHSKAAADALSRLAFLDALTQLPNRRLLLDRLDQLLASASRSRLCGALLFLDLDRFKAINDTHGHHIGDLLLVEVARRLKGVIRKGDTAARLGGDEFVVLLSALSSEAVEAERQAGKVASKVIETLSQPYEIEGRTLSISASAGVRVFLEGETASRLMEQADAAMYAAKSAGRNRWKMHAEKLH